METMYGNTKEEREEIRGEYWVDVCAGNNPTRRLWFYHSPSLESAQQFVIGLWSGVKLESLRSTGEPFTPPYTSTSYFHVALNGLKDAGYHIMLSHPFKSIEES